MPKTDKPKGKINSIMDAVTALTTLGDEESGSDSEKKASPEKKVEDSEEAKEEPAKEEDEDEGVKDNDGSKPRYIPEHKKPDAALTFPEKLMNMMRFADQFKDDDKFCIAWIADGKSFVIRNPDTFTRQVLPKFFKATKFQSFTRKLYRWGFRQVNRGIGPDDPIIFGNEFFQRDDEELMVKMRSVTAAANRKNRNDPNSLLGRKRSLEELDEQRKMILLDRLMQEKAAMGQDPRYMAQYANMAGLRSFPGGFPQGMPPGMMMQGRFPPGMMMQPGQQPPGGQPGQYNMEGQPPAEGGEGGVPPPMPAEGENKEGTPQQQQGGNAGGNGGSEQEIVNAAISALRYAS